MKSIIIRLFTSVFAISLIHNVSAIEKDKALRFWKVITHCYSLSTEDANLIFLYVTERNETKYYIKFDVETETLNFVDINSKRFDIHEINNSIKMLNGACQFPNDDQYVDEYRPTTEYRFEEQRSNEGRAEVSVDCANHPYQEDIKNYFEMRKCLQDWKKTATEYYQANIRQICSERPYRDDCLLLSKSKSKQELAIGSFAEDQVISAIYMLDDQHEIASLEVMFRGDLNNVEFTLFQECLSNMQVHMSYLKGKYRDLSSAISKMQEKKLLEVEAGDRGKRIKYKDVMVLVFKCVGLSRIATRSVLNFRKNEDGLNRLEQFLLSMDYEGIRNNPELIETFASNIFGEECSEDKRWFICHLTAMNDMFIVDDTSNQSREKKQKIIWPCCDPLPYLFFICSEGFSIYPIQISVELFVYRNGKVIQANTFFIDEWKRSVHSKPRSAYGTTHDIIEEISYLLKKYPPSKTAVTDGIILLLYVYCYECEFCIKDLSEIGFDIHRANAEGKTIVGVLNKNVLQGCFDNMEVNAEIVSETAACLMEEFPVVHQHKSKIID